MNIVFLDYDGVVNTLMFDGKKGKPYFNFPKDNKVNNFQAVCWLNKLCLENNAKIVVTSTWRREENYKECLYNGGLNRNIEILGKTDDLGTLRGYEIQKWLDDNKNLEIKNFVILDDENNMANLEEKLVQTDTYIGITYHTYNTATLVLKNRIKRVGKNYVYV